MVQKTVHLPESASQTAGPYVHIGLMPSYTGNGQIYTQEVGLSPIAEGVHGEIVTITGRCLMARAGRCGMR